MYWREETTFRIILCMGQRILPVLKASSKRKIAQGINETPIGDNVYQVVESDCIIDHCLLIPVNKHGTSYLEIMHSNEWANEFFQSP